MIDKQKKLEIIRDLAAKADISAYEIGQNTNISSSSAHKVLSGEQENPRTKTLNIILEYLEQKTAGIEGFLDVEEKYSTEFRNSFATEEKGNYNTNFNDLKLEEKLNELFKRQTTCINKIEVACKLILKIALELEDIKIKKTVI